MCPAFIRKKRPQNFVYTKYNRNFVAEKTSSNGFNHTSGFSKLIITILTHTVMINYKDLGLVNTRDMFARAVKGGYAIPAFNFNNMEQLQAIIKAAATQKSPVILQVSKLSPWSR